MADKVSGNAPPNLPPASEGPNHAPPSFKGGQWQAKPMTWLGMKFNADEAKKLWNIIIQTVSSAISKDKEEAIKAIKKMRTDQQDES